MTLTGRAPAGPSAAYGLPAGRRGAQRRSWSYANEPPGRPGEQRRLDDRTPLSARRRPRRRARRRTSMVRTEGPLPPPRRPPPGGRLRELRPPLRRQPARRPTVRHRGDSRADPAGVRRSVDPDAEGRNGRAGGGERRLTPAPALPGSADDV